MQPISFKRHRFHPDIIRHAVWLYFRFTLSLRDVEELLAERGIDVTYETIRCCADRFGPAIAANIRKRRQPADCVWHLDEMVVKIGGKRMSMWRAVDKEGEVLDVLVQKRRNKKVALKLLKKLLKSQGFVSTHSAVYNTFNTERHLVSRKTMREYRDRAFAEWQAASASVG